MFNDLRNIHTAFHSGRTDLCSPQQCTRAPFPPHPRRHLLLIDLLVTAILTGEVTAHCGFICISRMISDTEHLFMCLLAICSLWRSVYSGLLPIFKLDCLGGLGIEFYKFFINCGYKPLIRRVIGKYDLPFSGLSFHFVDGFLCCAKTF